MLSSFLKFFLSSTVTVVLELFIQKMINIFFWISNEMMYSFDNHIITNIDNKISIIGGKKWQKIMIRFYKDW